jgi:hypothetical protein
LDGPVEDVVVDIALAVEKVAEELAEIRVVGAIFKAELAAVVEIGRELDCNMRKECTREEERKREREEGYNMNEKGMYNKEVCHK